MTFLFFYGPGASVFPAQPREFDTFTDLIGSAPFFAAACADRRRLELIGYDTRHSPPGKVGSDRATNV